MAGAARWRDDSLGCVNADDLSTIRLAAAGALLAPTLSGLRTGADLPLLVRGARAVRALRLRVARDNEYGQEGYFTGAMAIDFVITGVLPLIAIFVLALMSRFAVVPLTIAGVTWTALFPIVFYRHTCAIWIVIDHLINPPSAAELAGEHSRDAGRLATGR